MHLSTGSLSFLIASFALLGSHAHEIHVTDGLCKSTAACDVYCEYGNVLDANGCQTCACINPCANHTCPIDQVCKIEPLDCTRPPFKFRATCGPQCPRYKCVANNCPYGYFVDENGCRGCGCIDHCKNHICEKDQICVVEKLCPFGECGIKPKCVKKCPLSLPCHSYAKCAYGFELDQDNCMTCNCMDPCRGVICPRGKYCSVTVLRCLVAPCPPPFPECHSYCPDNSTLLTGCGDKPRSCIADSYNCPNGYNCHNVPSLQSSYCCQNIESQIKHRVV